MADLLATAGHIQFLRNGVRYKTFADYAREN
jgi:hypothetical protein